MSATLTATQLKAEQPTGKKARVAIVGGGLAGLAAGCALADAGFSVKLFERKPFLGGRASSYQHPATGEVVDNCQHVLLGCCTNLLDFYKRLGVEDQIRWFEQLTFMLPNGKAGTIEPSGLPAPLHASPAFLKFKVLSLGDKLSIARAMLALMRGLPKESGDNFLSWLKRHGQTEHAINRFWAPVLISALNDDLDQVSVRYAAMVFRESFLKSAEAGKMGVPAAPLSDIYGRAGEYIEKRGGEVVLRASVDQLTLQDSRVLLRVNGEQIESDYVVLAAPFFESVKLLPEADSEGLRSQIGELKTVPITGIHFWFDREVTPLEHAVLLDRTIQWMFQKSKLLRGQRDEGAPLAAGSHIELVVSSSKSLLTMGRNEILDLALKEFYEFFPQAKEARVLKSAVIKEVHATFSPAPQGDRYRPLPITPWPRIFLSGDWTATGWPATMEGAVRGGYLTAEALSFATGNQRKFLVPDLGAKGLMKLFP
ncbi:Carotene 7,8-desaturase [Candidatus Koribacter versatilis Ellin345]|uniref:Carotene 7,8-desaturase n=1 Tax=Koribacter versatilis (strain Ellin345) TaxID=204669 RepID=Q1IQV2_KORVE|nr:hydroxysqualene dehydroxylase HpnE [Candidatus Koribacter versatilis]ABF40748.1 Carotene 7,8-desaturase [Candidatus Koribacter versatilis Ellin345]